MHSIIALACRKRYLESRYACIASNENARRKRSVQCSAISPRTQYTTEKSSVLVENPMHKQQKPWSSLESTHSGYVEFKYDKERSPQE